MTINNCFVRAVLLDRDRPIQDPGLRDLSQPAPYMHNGQFNTLTISLRLSNLTLARAGR
jgi:hypothetical protein